MRFAPVITILFIFSYTLACGQYYYQDIVVARQSAQQFSILKKHNIRKVIVTSFDTDDSPTPNFSLEQKVDGGRNQLTTFSQTDFTGKSELLTSFDDNGRVTGMVDSTNTVVVKTTYSYNSNGQLETVRSFSYDEGQMYVAEEDHLFQWDNKGQVTGMLRIKNGADTTRIVFVPEANGQPGEEQWWKGNRKIESWYYYYDEAGQLTDIVRFNARANQLLPDYLFEYEDNGLISKQTTILAGTSDYRQWYFAYDERGLKTGELILDKQQKPLGRTVYQYQ